MARYPVYAPDFRIQIDGENVPANLRASVISINYQDGMKGADRVEITLANDKLQWLDHPLLQPDNDLSLYTGYAPDPLEEVFVGEITGVNASFPSGGIATVTVVAHDFLHRLQEGKRDRAFKLDIPTVGHFPLPDAVVAPLVSLTDGLIPAMDPVGAALSFLATLTSFAIAPIDARRGVRLQQGQSDFEFLTQIAKDNGWEMYIDHSMAPKGYVLRFQFLVQDYSPSVALKWGESLIDFSPKLTTVGTLAGVAARIWVASIKVELMVMLSWNYDKAAFELAVYPGLGQLTDLLPAEQAAKVKTLEAVGPASAPQKILSELLPALNNRLTGSGNCVGNPNIKAGKVIQLDGLGEEFSGLYRITSSTHSFDASGYRTSFEARKEVWFGSIPTPKGVDGLVRLQGSAFG